MGQPGDPACIAEVQTDIALGRPIGDTYFYHDGVHRTTAMHRRLANGALAAIPEPDQDQDGIADGSDNCIAVANGPLAPDAGGNVQLNTDTDQFGNVCDCDFDQSGTCTIADFNIFLPDFFATTDSGLGTDMDGNGTVGIADFNLFLPGFQAGAPGP